MTGRSWPTDLDRSQPGQEFERDRETRTRPLASPDVEGIPEGVFPDVEVATREPRRLGRSPDLGHPLGLSVKPPIPSRPPDQDGSWHVQIPIARSPLPGEGLAFRRELAILSALSH